MAAKTYLAGDLGGTKTFLALYRDVEGQLEQAHSHRYVSAEWRDQLLPNIRLARLYR